MALPYELPNDPPIEPVYPELLILGGFARAVLQGVLRELNKRRTQQPKPQEKPQSKPGRISKDDLNEAQAQSLKRYEKKLPNRTGETKIIRNSDGSITYQSDVPAKNVPGSYARYEKTVDASGKTIRYKKTTYDGQGNVVHSKDKL